MGDDADANVACFIPQADTAEANTAVVEADMIIMAVAPIWDKISVVLISAKWNSCKSIVMQAVVVHDSLALTLIYNRFAVLLKRTFILNIPM